MGSNCSSCFSQNLQNITERKIDQNFINYFNNSNIETKKDKLKKTETIFSNNFDASLSLRLKSPIGRGEKDSCNFNNDEIDEKASNALDQKMFDNQSDLETIETIRKRNNIFLCPNKHPLLCNCSAKCAQCSQLKIGLACQKCKFHLCYECFGIDLNALNSISKKCIIEHPLNFKISSISCIKCGKNYEDGYKCSICKSFSLCIYCLGYNPENYALKSKCCMLDHPLNKSSQPLNCFNCRKSSKDGLACSLCKTYSLCPDCIEFDPYSFDSNLKCRFFRHPLIFHSTPLTCRLCDERVANGLRCSICPSYFICLSCSKFRFPTNSCPSNKILRWDPKEKLCSRCFSNKSGFECRHCSYRLCSLCKSPSPLNAISNRLLPLNANFLASGGRDNSIKMWDYTTGTSVKKLNGHTSFVVCLVKLNEKLMASGSWDNTIRIWNYTTGTCLKTLTGHTNTVYCVIKLNEKLIASSSSDNCIKIWDKNTGKCIKTFNNHSNYVRCLIKLNENQMASGSDDNSIKIWNYGKGKCLKALYGHNGGVRCLIKLNEQNIASCSNDKTIKIWNFITGKCIKTLNGHNNDVRCLIKSKTNQLVSGSYDNTIKIWNYKTGKCLKTLTGHTSYIRCLLNLNEKQIASGSNDNSMKIWDNTTGECIKTLNGLIYFVRGLIKIF